MAETRSGQKQSIRSFVEFSNAAATSNSQGAADYPRHDVLEYIHEMALALAHMARSQDCDGLSTLLQVAASEARDEICNGSPYPVPTRSETR